MKVIHVVFLVISTFTDYSADPVQPKTDPIRLPATPTPIMPPVPSVITSLAGDQLYVIDSDVSCIVLASPSGIVSVTEDTGPVKMRGKFVDGGGKAECRNFKGKTIYTIEAIANGRVELLIVPAGGAAPDVIRRTLDATTSQVPDPHPNPTPDPSPAPIVPTALWGFVAVEDTAEAVAARGGMLADPTLATLIKSKGYHWRIVDKDVVGSDGKPPADVLPCLTAAKGKPFPQVFLIDTKGNITTQTTLASPAGLVELLKKWGK